MEENKSNLGIKKTTIMLTMENNISILTCTITPRAPYFHEWEKPLLKHYFEDYLMQNPLFKNCKNGKTDYKIIKLENGENQAVLEYEGLYEGLNENYEKN